MFDAVWQIVWPLENGLTESDVWHMCNDTITGDTATQKCQDLLDESYAEDVTDCVYDVGVSLDLSWEKVTSFWCQTTINQCINANKNTPIIGTFTILRGGYCHADPAQKACFDYSFICMYSICNNASLLCLFVYYTTNAIVPQMSME